LSSCAITVPVTVDCANNILQLIRKPMVNINLFISSSPKKIIVQKLKSGPKR
jgi:hypothetical protein